MERLIVAAVLGAAAAVVALVAARRQGAPAASPSWTVPVQLHRGDFERPEAPWLVVLFSSTTCDACAGVRPKVEALRSDAVAVQEVDAVVGADLHRTYGVDAVPLVVVADAEGAVARSFVGPVGATDLWAAMAELREPGSTASSCGDDEPPATSA